MRKIQERVKVVLNPKSGMVVTPYQKDPSRGYIILQQERSSIDPISGNFKIDRRSFLSAGPVEGLTKYIADLGPAMLLPQEEANIRVVEYLESQVPAEFASLLVPTATLSAEDRISQYVKVAGSSNIPCTLGGERILRFTTLDMTGQEQDLKVHHDNGEYIRQANMLARAAEGSSMKPNFQAGPTPPAPPAPVEEVPAQEEEFAAPTEEENFELSSAPAAAEE